MGKRTLILNLLLATSAWVLLTNTISIPRYFREKSRSLEITEGEPSHIAMCRSILDRYDGYRFYYIHEDRNFCTNEYSYSSLIQIFASSFLHSAMIGKMKVAYNHQCGRLYFDSVQSRIRNPMRISTDSIGLEEIDQLCGKCVKEFDEFGNASPNCILFSPFFQESLTVDEKSQEGAKLLPKNAMEMMFPAIIENINVAISHGSRLTSNNADAVIYFSCETSECGGDIAGEFNAYSKEIPRSVQSIDIIISPCYEKLIGTFSVEKLKNFLIEVYPIATVKWEVESSTAVAYARMTNAKYLICPSGQACWLPALATQNHASVRQSPSLEVFINSIPISQMGHIQYYDPKFQQTDCLDLRGRFGTWKQDLNLAPALQYQGGITLVKDHVYKEESIRDSTTYKWTESAFPSCDMTPNLLTLDGLCSTLNELKVGRIFFIGDSMTGQQAKSLCFSLFGAACAPKEYMVLESLVKCPSPLNDFKVAFSRTDKMIDGYIPQWNAFLKNCDKCINWRPHYLSYPGRQVLVANTGLHYNTRHFSYQYAFSNWVKSVEEFQRPKDIVFFRTSVAGHPNCTEKFVPFQDYKDYQTKTQFSKLEAHQYGWHIIQLHNLYSIDFLEKRKRRDINGELVKIELLDVSPMTSLRQDGHIGFKGGATTGDCLHYILPGPVDWWNHLLFNNLVDLMNQEKMQSLS